MTRESTIVSRIKNAPTIVVAMHVIVSRVTLCRTKYVLMSMNARLLLSCAILMPSVLIPPEHTTVNAMLDIAVRALSAKISTNDPIDQTTVAGSMQSALIM